MYPLGLLGDKKVTPISPNIFSGSVGAGLSSRSGCVLRMAETVSCSAFNSAWDADSFIGTVYHSVFSSQSR